MRSGRIITFTSPRASIVALLCAQRAVADPDRAGRAVLADRLGVEQVRDTQEVGDEHRLRLLVDRLRRRRLLDAALVHHRDPVAHRERLLLIVGHEDERDPELGLERLELDLEVLAQLRVERAQRLVEQQHARPQHERARERDTLLLAARELVGLAPRELGQVDQLERLADPLGPLLLARACGT